MVQYKKKIVLSLYRIFAVTHNLCVTYSIIGVMMNKILAIDDDEEILKLIKTALESWELSSHNFTRNTSTNSFW